MKVIAIANQKGGIGKTTTTAALATGLKERGFKVLVIDIDPQGNLSTSSGADNVEKPTVYELLKREVEAQHIIQELDFFDIIPANVMLAGAEQELSQLGKEQRLKERLQPIKSLYDYIVIDTPPALGILTINAFTFADEIIIPTTPGIFAATGIKQLYETIQSVRNYCNDKVEIAGILITRFDSRINNHKDMKELTEQLGQYINTKVYKTYIRNSVVIEEAQVRQVDIYSYKENSTVALDYKAFVDEYLKGDSLNG